MSMRRQAAGVQRPCSQSRMRAQARQRLAVQLADPRLGDLQHRRRSPSGSARRRSTATSPASRAPAARRSRTARRASRPRSSASGIGPSSGVVHRAVVVASPIWSSDTAGSSPRPARCLVVLLDRHAERARRRRRRSPRGPLVLDLAQRLRGGARLAVHRARRPVELAHRVEHRAADADAGVGLETRAAVGACSAAPPRAGRSCRPGSGRRPPPAAAAGRPGDRRCASPARRASCTARPRRPDPAAGPACMAAYCRVHCSASSHPARAPVVRRRTRGGRAAPPGTGHVSAARQFLECCEARGSPGTPPPRPLFADRAPHATRRRALRPRTRA
jgi:hypothetical protein